MTAEEYVREELAAGRLTAAHIVELVEFFQERSDLYVDGRPGAKTRAAVDASKAVAGTEQTTRSPQSTPFLSTPLPTLSGGRKPVITSSFKSVNPSRPNHNGVDWFYRWQEGDEPAFVGDKGAATKLPSGKPKWGVPYLTFALAAASGTIQIASNSPTGYRCWIDHGNGWRTGYFHLMNLKVHAGEKVIRGQELGLVGDNPKDGDARHLHFELSPVDKYAPVNPEPFLMKP